MLGIYTGLGVAAASRFNLLSQVPLDLLPWLLVYFIIAYCLIGSLMLAVGSAVTEIREAQALFTPITILIILPFMLMVPIMQNPGSTLARVFSFFPPTTPYVMVMRLSQPSHIIPTWELIATALSGILGVVVTVWAAAKVFRVGVLMYGKPPTLMGLLKWVRQA
jgi:ABC-2 type transport system permease protein